MSSWNFIQRAIKSNVITGELYNSIYVFKRPFWLATVGRILVHWKNPRKEAGKTMMKLLHWSWQEMVTAWIRKCNKNTGKCPWLRYILEVDSTGHTKGLGVVLNGKRLMPKLFLFNSGYILLPFIGEDSWRNGREGKLRAPF